MSLTTDIMALRLSGQLSLAMKQAGEALAAAPGDFELMAETVRLLVVAQQAETASNLYQNFSAAGSSHKLEPEALVRLALQLGRWDLLKEMPTPEGPSWLVTALKEGYDPEGPFMPHGVKISVANGPSIFDFTGSCPHCNHPQVAQVPLSLLICRSWICPACFGRVKMDHHGVRSCMNSTYPDLLEMDSNQSDADLIDYLRPKLMGAEEMPQIAWAMGQEYHFLINEILVGLMGDQNNEGGQA